MLDKRHNKDKFPEIWAAFERKKARKTELMTERKIHTEQMNILFRRIEDIQVEIDSISKLAYKDKDEIFSLSREISTMARAMGGKTLEAPLPAPVSPEDGAIP